MSSILCPGFLIFQTGVLIQVIYPILPKVELLQNQMCLLFNGFRSSVFLFSPLWGLTHTTLVFKISILPKNLKGGGVFSNKSGCTLLATKIPYKMSFAQKHFIYGSEDNTFRIKKPKNTYLYIILYINERKKMYQSHFTFKFKKKNYISFHILYFPILIASKHLLTLSRNTVSFITTQSFENIPNILFFSCILFPLKNYII